MLAQAEAGFRSRVVRAASWTAAAHAFTQVLRFGGNLLMTRLLAPEAFGLMAVVTTILVGLALFSDFGLRHSIVQSRRGSERAFVNTVWTAQILRGGVLFLIMQAGALIVGAASHRNWFPAGSVYQDPMLPGMIHAMAWTFLIGAFDSTKLATAQRGMALGRVVMLEVGCHAAGLLATLLWGLAFRDVWALVVGAQVAVLLRVVLGHVVLPGERDRLQWDAGAWREIFSFGKWIFLSSMLGFFAGQGDRLLLGVLVDSKTLGLTAIAMLILAVFQEGFAKIVTGVAFPALSETVRNKPERLKDVYYQFRALADAGFFLLAGFFFVAGASLLGLIYDTRYAEAGLIFSILSLGLIAAPCGVAQQAYLALGRSDLLTWTTAARLVAVMALVIPAGSIWGLHGAIWALVIAHLPAVLLTLHFNARLGILEVRQELQRLPCLLIGALAGVAVNYVLARP